MGVEEQPKPAAEDSKDSSVPVVVVAVTSEGEPKTQEQKMVVSKIRNSAPQPSWFTPKRYLLFFSGCLTFGCL